MSLSPITKRQVHRKRISDRLGTGMIAAAWIVLLGLLTVYFNGWLREQENPNQHPLGTRTETGAYEVVLAQNRQGHYMATGTINGHPVQFLLDTGATTVSVSTDLAESLQLPIGPASTAWTANGTITTYHTRLDEVRIGNILLHDVRATINPHMHIEAILLGMSFLKKIEFTQRGDTLTLRQFRTE
uniref:Aspartyl protease family protein n=1 Tax=Candidatus Kentrum sp. TUN TaxID=2126343 RepID=A0A451AHL7_9GAMM|nr:MAG: aspartyl protease family protein [Candidatus Kentron sp. TUN]VFK65494.1 MAG: aspartyl protease family protein [Candidatus Kentron sp. TUN]